MFKSIFRKGKIYVLCHYTIFIICWESCSNELFVTDRLYADRQTTTSLLSSNHVCIPYSAQVGCKTFAFIQISLLIKSYVSRKFCILSGSKSNNFITRMAKCFEPIFSTYKLQVKRIYTTYFISCYSCFKSRFLVQIRCISSKHIRISSFGESQVSNP
jgi:hypothetical protein